MKINIKGFATPAVLIISSSLVIVLFALLLILSLVLDYSNRQVAQEQALNIAEAGINYYKWHLAHATGDFQDGTGNPGPYLHDYLDPNGTKSGKFSLIITPPSNGSSIVGITSTGYTNQYPGIKRTITAQYGKPSFARFSFLHNASGWYGEGITVHGNVHSNNGIRMDGINTNLVTSAKQTYICGSETGCTPSRVMPGVWGSGPGGALGLWQFPRPTIDFDMISFDFASMKQSALTDGLHLPSSGASGYHLIFNQDATVSIYRVTATGYYNSQSAEDSCRRRYERISSQTLVSTHQVIDVPIIFAEDTLWVEGVIKGNVTIAAVKFPIESSTTNIWIPNNLTYASYDHTNSLGLIAQTDIYFTRDIPEDFKVDGVLMAQKGKIIRHGYLSLCGYSSTHSVKNKLTINGAIISYNKSYWNYGSGPSSGFITREINYDADLLYKPPPYFPTTSEYEFISWSEE